jgi:DNA repair protein RadC
MDKLFVEDKGQFREASDQDVFLVASMTAKRRMVPGIEIEGIDEAKKLLVPLLAGKDYEVFCVAFLDGEHKLITFEEIFRGTIDQTPAYPREVFKRALELAAVGLILVHNHPSGNAEPSNPDLMTTLRMTVVGKLMNVNVLDHFIVNGAGVRSLRQSGDLSPDRLMKMMSEEMLGGHVHTIEIEHDGKLPPSLEKLLKELKKKLN